MMSVSDCLWDCVTIAAFSLFFWRVRVCVRLIDVVECSVSDEDIRNVNIIELILLYCVRG